MTFLLDENIPKSAIEIIGDYGHSVIDIRGTEHEGSSDEEIFNFAQNKKAVVITTDRDFFHTISSLYENHYGIIVITLRQPNRNNILEWL